jgi:hypothetical protein
MLCVMPASAALPIQLASKLTPQLEADDALILSQAEAHMAAAGEITRSTRVFVQYIVPQSDQTCGAVRAG